MTVCPMPVIVEKGVHPLDAFIEAVAMERIEQVMIDGNGDAVVTEFLDDGDGVLGRMMREAVGVVAEIHKAPSSGGGFKILDFRNVLSQFVLDAVDQRPDGGGAPRAGAVQTQSGHAVDDVDHFDGRAVEFQGRGHFGSQDFFNSRFQIAFRQRILPPSGQ